MSEPSNWPDDEGKQLPVRNAAGMTPAAVWLVAALAALGACSGDDSKDGPTACTACVTYDDDDDDDATPAPYLFDDDTLDAAVDCVGSTVSFTLGFLGEPAFAILDVSDSGNVPSWNEYHSLDVSGVAADGSYAELVSDLIDVGVEPTAWGDGEGTVFTCSAHFDDPAIMTYTARAYDLDGALADCVAWGHDPEGMVAGTYFVNNPPLDPEHLVACRLLAAAE